MNLIKDAMATVVRAAVYRNPLVWLAHWTRILIDGVLARMEPNILQRRFVEVVLFCLQNDLPIRIIVLKPRQRGISTISVGVLFWLLIRFPRRGVIIGRKGEQTDNLWRMFRRYWQANTFPWGSGVKITDEEAVFERGSTCTKTSAEALDPGRSDTYQCVVATEVAYWGADSKVKNAGAVLAGLMACVKALARSFVVLESTSAGPSGTFYRYWQEAIEFEDFKRDPVRHHGRFVRVFAGVFEFPDCCDAISSPKEAAELMDGVGALNEEEAQREQELIHRYGLSAGQVKFWRRILLESDNDPSKRDLDYPCTPEDAFRAGQLCFFNWGGLKRLRQEAKQNESSLRFGTFNRTTIDSPPVWHSSGGLESGGDFCIAEPPIEGCRYVLVVDTAKGIRSGEDKRNTDSHAPLVYRCGYFDSQGRWQRGKVVACIVGERRRMGSVLRLECKLQPFELTERIIDLYDYYGQPTVVVENNNDPGVIPLLKRRKVRLYVEKHNALSATKEGLEKDKLGFTMGDVEARTGVRSTILHDLNRAVIECATRGAGIEIPFFWMLDEMEHFVNDPDTGKAEAAPGWHDDWVMALAIAVATQGSGRIYVAPVHAPTLGRRDPGRESARFSTRHAGGHRA